ncbi:lytic murein transglycosylase [Marinobacter bryozoorum]|uniref:lytic murein transglycosylase n=1 Tax=Marinobacter bryozoorum TaxID=256324 RepID=UPI002003AD18|nr:lytic murein transglycosylase [Marinobacter bryozoorum]MCK7542665.1 lytic murein transglycosylase [Marinobacter bryozoorum]
MSISPNPQRLRSGRISARLGLVTAGVLIASAAAAETPAVPQEPDNFGQCLQDIEQRAVAEGVSPATASKVLADVEFLPRVIELDRRQPEFTTTFADYLGRRVSETRIEKGREMLEQHRDLLDRVSGQTGVPPAYLVAFWGLETNYGSYFGKMPVPSALATLACDQRRGRYFSGELVSALKILDEGAIEPERMEGSWAGAMGHVQFMPSVFLRHATDADGDGRRDLWDSVPDAMMSAGRFLESMGWDPGYRWGREVILPDNFDYALAGQGRRSLGQWSNLGITDVHGQPLADEPIKAKLVVPAGHRGPAFLAYDNFRVIMGWNRSEYYAIAVGHLADRIAGAGDLSNPPPEDAPTLSRDDVLQLQAALNERGFEAGTPDGIIGPKTRSAIRRYQVSAGLVADGFPGPELLDSLGVIPSAS